MFSSIVLALVIGVITPHGVSTQQALDRKELAVYRLTSDRFEKFQQASDRIAIVIERDEAFGSAPLFSQQIAQGGDVVAAAVELEARLLAHVDLARALQAAHLSAREFTKFALALLAARLAHGFLDVGLLKTIPAGPASDNVAFVRAQLGAVDAVLSKLRVEIK